MATRKLVDKTITTALTGNDIYVGDVYYSSWPLLSAAFLAVFDYGSNGTSVDAYVQTSIDGGVTWIDVLKFSFLQVDLTQVANLSSLTPVTSLYTPTDGSISAAAKDGILGQHWRVKIKSSGTYAGSTNLKIWSSFKAAMIG